MSRAALLPHPADPFLFKYWLKFFDEIWGQEVDKLYILINSPIEKPVIDYMLSLTEGNPKIATYYVDHQMEHGAGIDYLLDRCEEDYIMLIEDDGYIFKPGYVDKFFGLLESGQYDVIGSPRGSCGMEIYERAKDKWSLDYSGLGDHGPNFWPNFFFSSRQTLIDTDRNFGARSWSQGEKIEALNYIVKDEVCPGDTFVNTSLQLRAKIPADRVLEIPQYHRDPNDVVNFENKQFLFDGHAPWIHVGSLSSGVHGILVDAQGRCLGRRLIDPPKDISRERLPESEGERWEWESRVTFWEFFLQNALPDMQQLEEFYMLYRAAVDRIIQTYGLSRDNIEKRKAIYHQLGL